MDWMKLFVIGSAENVEALYRSRGLDRFQRRPPEPGEYWTRGWLDDDLVRLEFGLYCEGSWEEHYGAFFRTLFADIRDGDLGVVVAVHVIHMHDTEHCHSCVNYVVTAGSNRVEKFVRDDFVKDSDDGEGASRDRMLAEAEVKYDKHILRALSALR